MLLRNYNSGDYYSASCSFPVSFLKIENIWFVWESRCAILIGVLYFYVENMHRGARWTSRAVFQRQNLDFFCCICRFFVSFLHFGIYKRAILNMVFQYSIRRNRKGGKVYYRCCHSLQYVGHTYHAVLVCSMVSHKEQLRLALIKVCWNVLSITVVTAVSCFGSVYRPALANGRLTECSTWQYYFLFSVF